MGADESSASRQLRRKAPPPSRVVIADDHPLYRFALRIILDREADLEVVAEASDGQEALELCRRLRPELMVVDVYMPRMDGLEATRAVRTETPSTIVMVVTAYEQPDLLAEALKAGAAGFLLKTASPSHIVESIRKALAGESPLNHEVATRLLRRLVEEQPKEESLPDTLSPREVEVLQLMAGGHTNEQIARKLLLSTSTVKKHVHSVITKLEVSDRTQAAIKALELGVRPEQHDKD